jgi:hypothetical protein
VSASIETKRVKEALELQVAAIRTHAERLSTQDMDALESELVEVERAMADLRGMVTSLPHRNAARPSAGVSPASPATSRGERVAKGSAAADPSQRRNE